MEDSLTILLVIAAAIGHAVFWAGFVNRTHAYGWPSKLVDMLTVLSAALAVGLPLLAVRIAWQAGSVSAILEAGWMGWYAAAMIVLCGAALLHSAWLARHPERRGALLDAQVRSRDFREELGLEIARPVPRAFCRLPGNEVLRLSIEEKRLAIDGLPTELVGLKIAQLSDLHMSGRFGLPLYQSIVQITNEWGPDLVALTGDLVEKDRCLPWIAETFGRLSAPLGVFYVLGNHDKKCSHQQVRQLLNAGGTFDVSQQRIDMAFRGAKIEVTGNELPWFRRVGDFRDQTAFRLLLAHGPDQFDWAIERGVHLMLAGHNHGGQVRFPLVGALLTPSRFGTRYCCGVFQRAGTVMHVSRGTGSLAPFRYSCPPELSLLTLVRA